MVLSHGFCSKLLLESLPRSPSTMNCDMQLYAKHPFLSQVAFGHSVFSISFSETGFLTEPKMTLLGWVASELQGPSWLLISMWAGDLNSELLTYKASIFYLPCSHFF